MISKEHRFHGRNSLNFVYRQGETYRSSQLNLKVAKNNKESYRLAVVVSKKVSKSAVVRNRIRRRIYEQARQLLGDNNHSYDLVVSVFDENITTLSAPRLEELLRKLLDKAGVLAG